MSRSERQDFPGKTDGLRLFALGRIPRCERCPRYHALSLADPRTGRGRESLPAVPEFCTYQLCAPLAAHYEEQGTVSLFPESASRPVPFPTPRRTHRA